jgi:hypothetical protein
MKRSEINTSTLQMDKKLKRLLRRTLKDANRMCKEASKHSERANELHVLAFQILAGTIELLHEEKIQFVSERLGKGETTDEDH